MSLITLIFMILVVCVGILIEIQLIRHQGDDGVALYIQNLSTESHSYNRLP